MQREVCPDCNHETKHGIANHKCKKKVRCEFCKKKIKLYKSVRHQEKCEILQNILSQEPDTSICPHCQSAFPSNQLSDHILAHEIASNPVDLHESRPRRGSRDDIGRRQQRESSNHSSSALRIRAQYRNRLRIIEIFHDRNPENILPNRGMELRRVSFPSRPPLQHPKPEVAKNLPVSRFDGKIQLTCVICLSNIKEKKRVKTLPCLHQFHKRCIDQWLESSCLCPMCKMSI